MESLKRFLVTARDPDVEWVRTVCIALNSYWGGELLNDSSPSALQLKVVESLLNEVHRLSMVPDVVSDFDWKDFFSARTIDYRGEEIKTAKYFSWRNIGPALPKQIGVAALVDLCEHGCKHYVENFPEYLKSPDEWPLIKPSRVMVHEEDWDEVACNLVKAGVCAVIPESEIFHVRGEPPEKWFVRGGKR